LTPEILPFYPGQPSRNSSCVRNSVQEGTGRRLIFFGGGRVMANFLKKALKQLAKATITNMKVL
jgi:hypothetical protein